MAGLRVNLEHWAVLQAVVEQGGFAQAAAYLHRSQSAVSYAVARLQEQLGVPLLRLEGRRARLTEAGEALLSRAAQLLRDAEALERFARGLEQGWEAEVRLVVDGAFPAELLMTALRRFEPQSRGSRVQLEEVVLSGAEEALEQGRADLAIGGWVPPDTLGEPLLDVRFVAVSSPDHPLQGLGRPIALGDLQRELQLVIRDSGRSRPRDVGWLGAEHRWSLSSIDSAVAAVSHGLGYAWLPEHRIRDLLEQGRLKPLPLTEGGSYRTSLYLIFRRPDHPGPASRLLAKLLKEVADEGG
jgi:DNA-binding transcriptional LysR family regulator